VIEGSRAVSNRSLSLLSAAGAMALLPLALHGNPQVAVATKATVSVPVTIDVSVMTATRSLNLAALSPADFGDDDAVRE
jgi:hypothetical protein